MSSFSGPKHTLRLYTVTILLLSTIYADSSFPSLCSGMISVCMKPGSAMSIDMILYFGASLFVLK